MTKFSEAIVNKIKKEHIAPVPRWHFLFKACTLWSLFALSVALGSLSFSVIVHIVRSRDLDVFNHLHGNLFTSIVMLLPYIWLLFLSLFAVLAYLNLKNTKHGYCYRRRWIVLGSMLVSILLGGVLYFIGLGRQVDGLMTKAMPFYNQSKHRAMSETWFHPERGLLTGKIMKIDENIKILTIIDESGKTWIVDSSTVKWENPQLAEKGKIIKIIGVKEGEDKFRAKEIRRCGDCQDDEGELLF